MYSFKLVSRSVRIYLVVFITVMSSVCHKEKNVLRVSLTKSKTVIVYLLFFINTYNI